MRVDDVDGVYLQYKDSGRPVEVLDRTVYSFQDATRTCLVRRPDHLGMLLRTDRYRIVAVEVPESSNGASADREAQGVTPARQRAKKGRA